MAEQRAHGADISWYQRDFDINLVTAKDLEFIIFKSSEETRIDAAFETLINATGAIKIRGAYHYYRTRTFKESWIDNNEELIKNLEQALKAAERAKKKKKTANKDDKKKNKNAKNVEAEKRTSVWVGNNSVSVFPSQVKTRNRDGSSWQEQADFFIKTVEGKNLDFYALDIETGPNIHKFIGNYNNVFTAADLDDMSAWINYVREKTGKPVLLYTSPYIYCDFLRPYDRGQNLLRMPLWLAAYNIGGDRNKVNPLRNFAGGKMDLHREEENWHFWQYSADKNEKGSEYGLPPRHDGSSVDIDLDVFNGTLDDLKKWIGQKPGSIEKPVDGGDVANGNTSTSTQDPKSPVDGSSLPTDTGTYPGLTNKGLIDELERISNRRFQEMLISAGLDGKKGDADAHDQSYTGPTVDAIKGLSDEDRSELNKYLAVNGFISPGEGKTQTKTSKVHYPGLTNQDMIQVFYRAATSDTYWEWIVTAKLQGLAASQEARKEIYAGPKIEDLPGLSASQKQALLSKM